MSELPSDPLHQMIQEALQDRSLNVSHAAELCHDLLIAAPDETTRDELRTLLTGLVSNEADRLVDTLKSSKRAFWLRQQATNKNDYALGLIELVMAVCYHEQRDFQRAANTLRSVLTRFQQLESVDNGLFVRTACMLATVYCHARNFSAARTAVKQAYRLATSYDAPPEIQWLVLEELADCFLLQKQYHGAYDALTKLSGSLTQPNTTSEAITAVKLRVKLGLCQSALFMTVDAERSLLDAAEIYNEFLITDRALRVRLLEALAGVLRALGQFMQADFVEQKAMELVGRLEQMGGHFLYGSLLQEAALAESMGQAETASACYRRALVALETQYEKRYAERLHILARLFLCTTPEQKLQRASLLTEIEDSALGMFSSNQTTLAEAVDRVRVLFFVCGDTQAANTLNLLLRQLRDAQAQAHAQAQSSITASELRLLTDRL